MILLLTLVPLFFLVNLLNLPLLTSNPNYDPNCNDL